jgi:hypothetical protein
MYRSLILLLLVTCAHAHEMVPAYPKMESSHVAGVSKTSVEVFNRREDVQYYEVGVFTKDWTPVRFVTAYNIIKLNYLGRVKIDVYIRDEDVASATYICSQSKIRSDMNNTTAVSSKICSKLIK